MNLAALTDRPAVSRFPQRVCHNLEPERVSFDEGERVSFDHDRIMRQWRQARHTEIPLPCSNWPTTDVRQVLTTIQMPSRDLNGNGRESACSGDANQDNNSTRLVFDADPVSGPRDLFGQVGDPRYP
jgi:hypothetical protein